MGDINGLFNSMAIASGTPWQETGGLILTVAFLDLRLQLLPKCPLCMTPLSCLFRPEDKNKKTLITSFWVFSYFLWFP